MIFAQPVGALEALRQYRRGDLGAPSTGVCIGIAPLIAKGRAGLALVLRF
jgi:hypothetical protein